jgi:zinc transport system substrate-binding protein
MLRQREKTMGRRLLAGISTVVLLLATSMTAAQEKLAVYAVNYPLQYFAQRIAGDLAEVVLPLPPAVDPAFWQPDVAAIAGFQQADIILLNGAGYAQWVNRVSLPRRKLVDTSIGFRDRYIYTAGEITHSHGREGDHSHSGTAFTTWLDFSQAMQQAEAILRAMQRQRPGDSALFAANFARLQQDLQALDTAMLALPEQATDRRFMASHPVYQYLARRYRLDLAVMTWEPDEFPGPEQWQQFNRTLEQQAVEQMLWEAGPLEQTTLKLQDLGISVVVFAPCMNVPDEGDFLTVMQQNVENLAMAIRGTVEQ